MGLGALTAEEGSGGISIPPVSVLVSSKTGSFSDAGAVSDSKSNITSDWSPSAVSSSMYIPSLSDAIPGDPDEEVLCLKASTTPPFLKVPLDVAVSDFFSTGGLGTIASH